MNTFNPKKMYRFKIVDELQEAEKEIELNPGDVFRFGRADALKEHPLGYHISNSSVSRLQATVTVSPDGQVIIAADGDGRRLSSTGIRDARGSLITRFKQLHPGDLIYVVYLLDYGKVSLRFQPIDDTDEVPLDLQADLRRMTAGINESILTEKVAAHEIHHALAVLRHELQQQHILLRQDLFERITELKLGQEKLKQAQSALQQSDRRQNQSNTRIVRVLVGIAIVFSLYGGWRIAEGKHDLSKVEEYIPIAAPYVLGFAAWLAGGKFTVPTVKPKPEE